QEAVDAIIDNGRRGRPVTGPGSRPLTSLSDMLKGKQGRFRQNLLGKRVDYSGRSVIVVGPELKFYQCGLPKKMALELFKPFIMKKLVENGYAHNIKSAKRMVEKIRTEVWDVLEEVIKEHPVMLNRAPTLHRLGIQAFEPILVEGKAIKLHPLVCTAFNADFDGDQMAVHVPLSVEAQAEARFLMLSTNNILAPKDGSPIATPTQDMILGSYYLTYQGVEDRDTYAEKGDGKIFTNIDEMIMAYRNGVVGIHARVKVRMYAGEDDERGKLIESTVGRFIFNREIPQNLGYVDREKDKYSLEIDFLCDKKKLTQIIDRCYRVHSNTRTVLMLDYIKTLGFHYSTKGAVTISISDMEIPAEKYTIIAASEKEVEKYEKAYKRGLMSNQERYEKVISIWSKTADDVADALMRSLGSLNNLFIMANSGARGSKSQIRQIGGMRGLMANATGKTVEIPIKANFREGLSVLEYFISSNGARKGLADTALRTADSGYLTRRLVDVSHNVIVREFDCGTDEGIEVRAFMDGKEEIESLKLRIIGRTSLKDIYDPTTGALIVEQNEEISEEAAEKIENSGIDAVAIRSVMTCHSQHGICAKCYGRNLATGESVNIGEAVGITAAQSIGEPGTQLTMRTFHTGGVAGSDITQGLPRVEELFEARKPKGIAEICEEDGTVVSIHPRPDNKTEVKIRGEEETVYVIPYGAILTVKEGDYVLAGQNITKGPLNPHDILRLNGIEGVYQYLIKEVQRVYKNQGVDINDKHVEVIVSQMLSKFKIEDSGDTNLLPGGLYSKFEVKEENDTAIATGTESCQYKRVLLGITKASLATNSFLSAASFQETTRVLTDAAIKGKNDKLLGLKENVIIGKLIPAGTGMKRYKNINLDYGVNTELMESYELENREENMMAEMAQTGYILGHNDNEDDDYSALADMQESYQKENDIFEISEDDIVEIK
ncbi:MAG: DNA-directed RNA polymerase subunit beta', partial [Eubacteriales bacterium]|nr:DNA-directed RNA polymerase subunit beta' [Eubacteriales bacterium]